MKMMPLLPDLQPKHGAAKVVVMVVVVVVATVAVAKASHRSAVHGGTRMRGVLVAIGIVVVIGRVIVVVTERVLVVVTGRAQTRSSMQK
jgi:hypothetical protein